MKRIERNYYLKKLVNAEDNGLIKIITGVRRCGKSYLLNKIFYDYLINEEKIESENIIQLDLDKKENAIYLNSDELYKFLNSKINLKDRIYILLDEIQLVNNFESVLNSFIDYDNINIYVTGSNSKFLSKDIITEFRGRGYQISMYPLSFAEYYSAMNEDKYKAWQNYLMYGGMPFTLSLKGDNDKSNYLKNLFKEVYEKDIIDRYKLQKSDALENLISILASNIGSLTNPTKLFKIFEAKKINISNKTINSYINYLEESYLISRAERYDIKGKKFIDSPYKYYFTDLGLRNARLNFRQIEFTHLLENAIYNELVIRGYNVDVGIIEKVEKDDGKSVRKTYEVDFICNLGEEKIYIQSAYSLPNEEKFNQEKKSLENIDDSFKKVIIVNDILPKSKTEEGIIIMNVIDFMLDKNSLNI